MTARWLIQNLAVYSLQVAIVVASAATAIAVARLRDPHYRLRCAQLLLLICVLMPIAQPWRAVPTGSVQILASGAVPDQATAAALAAAPRPFPWAPVLVALWVFVAAGRVLWLGIGMMRLRRFIRRARPVYPLSDALAWAQCATDTTAEFWISRDVQGPTTFGLWRPMILLPERFDDFDRPMQEAIACHELLHVRRRDWAYTMMEELVRCVFWFHPAIWWVLGQVHLAREQAVDHSVVRITQQRDSYLKALLTVASVYGRLDLAPAPLFLKKRHLAQRVGLLVKEVPMSKRRLMASAVSVLALFSGAAIIGARLFPLQAAPQESQVRDDAGVAVSHAGVRVIHRTAVHYPSAAKAKRIEGIVNLEVRVDERGNVSDVRVVSGPEALRRAALQAVLEWHYANDTGAPGTVQSAVEFKLPPESPTNASPSARPAFVSPAVPHSLGTYKGVVFNGVDTSLRQQILNTIPIREGDELTPDRMGPITEAVRAIDEHYTVSLRSNPDKTVNLMVMAPSSGSTVGPGDAPGRIRVGGNVQAMNLIEQARPVYPPLAKQARIQGAVRLNVIINKDGHVDNVSVAAGHPLLVPPALEAVKQWVYKPTLLNGNPVEVVTTVDVNFTLAGEPPPPPPPAQ